MDSGEDVRLKLTLHYDGSRFHGWQIQPRVRTVQGELEAAVERLTGSRRTVTGSGRTDRGVHATGQVASVTLPERWTAGSFRKAMNAVLPDDVWVARTEAVRPEFHPRFDAVARTYRYRLGTAPEAWSPFHRPWLWALKDAPDPDVLVRAAAFLPGEHSFRAFAKSGQPERGERCRVAAAVWDVGPDGGGPDGMGPVFRVTADRYLHRMVRYLVGTMVEAARGRRSADDLRALLEEPGGGLETSPPAPPEGLYLQRVEYPPGAERATDADPGPAAERRDEPEGTDRTDGMNEDVDDEDMDDEDVDDGAVDDGAEPTEPSTRGP